MPGAAYVHRLRERRRLLAEPARGDPLSEAELSLIWAGQRFPRGALSGPDGREVEVLNPGRRGSSAGPDFRDAVIRLGGRERRGDVELHVRASYHLAHGHHLDPAYDGLILHVVFLDDAGGRSPLACGGSVPVAAFAPWVRARSADIASWLKAPPLWQEPCRGASARLGEYAVIGEVRRMGAERFRSKARLLAAAAAREGPQEALWQALLEACGYGGDREGFRRLGRALPYALLARLMAARPGAEAEAAAEALRAVAGLGPPPESADLLPPPISPPLRNLASRPANRPERRLAGAAALLAPGRLSERALEEVVAAADGRRLLAAWTRPAAGAGPARATEVLLNAVLPFAAAVRPDLEGRCLELAASLPALPPYGKTSFLEANLAPAGRGRTTRTPLDQQGLLALHAEWCSQGGCGRCPLSREAGVD